MPFRLRCRESVTEGLHRIVREEFAGAQAKLRAIRDGPDPDDAVHETRKHLKKLRALCHLWQAPLGPEHYLQESAILRDLAQEFSDLRDTEVRLAVFHRLIRKWPPAVMARCRRIIALWERERLNRLRSAAHPDAIAKSSRILAACASRFELFPLHPGGWDLIGNALKHSYRRARKSFAYAIANPNAEGDWHDWRKRSKVLEYQLALLRHMDPEIRGQLRDLDHLTECLGNDRDLALLEAALQKGPPLVSASRVYPRMARLISPIRARLKAKAEKLAAEVFASGPWQFVHRLEKRWKEWRS